MADALRVMKIVRPRRLYEQIAGQIEAFIREERLQPGVRIPAEREFAERLGVSRPSVREAMIALETAGLIETRVGGGTFVKAPTGTRAIFAVPSHPDLGPGPLEQFEARRAIETACAVLAASNATEDDLAQLQSSLTRMQRAVEEGQSPAEEHRTFHVLLAEASRNTILSGAVRELWRLRQGEMWDTLRKRVDNADSWRLGLKFRRALIGSIERRDEGAVRRAVEAHFKRLQRLYFEGGE